MAAATARAPATPASPSSTALVASAKTLDAAVKQCAMALHDELAPSFARAMAVSGAIQQLSGMITPDYLREIMALQNTKLGFMTDKAKDGGYSAEVVKRVVIEGLLAGVYPVGNEFNIIAGGLYITQAGYKRKVQDLPGVGNLETIPGIPKAFDGQMTVRIAASWTVNGKRDQLLDHEGKPGRIFSIITNSASTADNIIGKGLRKCYKAIFEKITGQRSNDGDEDPGDGIGSTSRGEAPPLADGRASFRNGPPVQDAVTEPPAAAREKIEDFTSRLNQANTEEDLLDLEAMAKEFRVLVGETEFSRSMAAIANKRKRL